MVAIIGAGISGMSLGQMLSLKGIACKLYEKSSRVGGIAHVETIEGVPFHITGGHCFNSKYSEVLDFVFKNILPENEWNLVERQAKILIRDHLINYPIERSIKEIFSFSPRLGTKILFSLFVPSLSPVKNLEDWFVKKFGNVLAKEYFIPYNEKIWQKSLKEIDPLWVNNKLPMTSRWEILKSFFGEKESKMPHSQFFYPKKGQNQLVESLAENLDIQFKSHLKNIRKQENQWLVDGKAYKFLVYTGPLNLISEILADVPPEIISKIKSLKYNKITTSLWRTDPVRHTWTYVPGEDSPFHRQVEIGNFLAEKKPGYTIAEKTGVYSEDEIKKMGSRVKGFKSLLAHYTSDHAYVIFDKDYQQAMDKIVSYFHSMGVILLGRFAEWQYYNMDVCMKRALEVSQEIETINKQSGI